MKDTSMLTDIHHDGAGLRAGEAAHARTSPAEKGTGALTTPTVTVFCYYYYPYGGGGADRAMQRVAETLARQGWQLSVVTKPLKGSPRREVVNGVQVYRTREVPLPGLRFISYMLAAFGHQLLRRDNGAVLHLNQLYMHMPLAIWLRRLRGSRVVVTLQCGGEHGDIARARRLPLGLGRWVLRASRQADACISLSNQLTEEALEAGFARERIVQIPNGVDSTHFAPVSPAQRVSLRKQLDLPLDRPVVLFAARLEPQKAVDVLLRAWKTVHEHQPHALLALAGDGSLRGQLEALSRDLQLGESARFLGWTEQVLALYQSSDVYVLPSWSEGMPNALLEAMACGLMPVATAISGTTDVVTHERDGLLAPPGNEAELAAALERAISDEALRASLAAAARQRVLDHFTIEQVARQYADVYQRVTAKTQADGAKNREAGVE
jgi:glycosyltransferase involved in cell wall biosynthesis